MTTLQEALAVYAEDKYHEKHIQALDEQRKLFTANLGCDMGDDWFNDKGRAFRQKSLVYYVRKYVQASMNRQFGMAARQTHGMIKLADENSKMASMENIVMELKEGVKVEDVREKVPAIFMEKIREQAKERRAKARRLSR